MISIVAGLGAALCWATGTLCAAEASRRIGALSVLAWVMVIGLTVTAPIAVVSGVPRGLHGVEVTWFVLAGGLAFALRAARSMNVMALLADAAATLGIRVGALRKGLFFCSGLLTASAVTIAGSIGFIGLIVPHACRFAFGPDHRLLVPGAALAGGSYLVLADTVARTVIAPQQLPAGVVTALVGTPVFLYQLHRLKK